MFAGQVIAACSVSLTVTMKLQTPTLPETSVAVQFTVFTPFANAVPDAGEQIMGTAPAQLSVAVGRA
jgi:hypothetical protein